MKYKHRMPTRDELICVAPTFLVAAGLMIFAAVGALMGWLPRTSWVMLLLIAAGYFLSSFLNLTPPVLHARERLIKRHVIEPSEVDREPDLIGR